MKQFLLLLFTCISTQLAAQYSDVDIQNYIDLYKKVALTEQGRSGVPASITLAQGILESAAGTSELATNAKNHFGIKCKNTWTGNTYNYTDDRKDECFRAYDSDIQSYKDHSDFLKNNNRYNILFSYPQDDYMAWANGLQKCGYATSPTYAGKLIGLIERFQLDKVNQEIATDLKPSDIIAPDDAPVKISSTKTTTENTTSTASDYAKDYYQLTKLHGINGFYARKGDMLLSYAIENKIRYAKLLSINDLKDEPLPNDMFIYLDRKNQQGERPTTIVGTNENLQLISQREGITLESLRTLNLLNIDEEPAIGSELQLQNTASKKPYLTTDKVAIPTKEPLTEQGLSQASSDNSFIEKPTAQINSNNVVEKPIETIAKTTPAKIEKPAKPIVEQPKEIILDRTGTAQVITEKPIDANAEIDSLLNEQTIVEKPVIEKPIVKKPVTKRQEPKSDLDKLKDQFDQSIYGYESRPTDVQEEIVEKTDETRTENYEAPTSTNEVKKETIKEIQPKEIVKETVEPVKKEVTIKSAELNRKAKENLPKVTIEETTPDYGDIKDPAEKLKKHMENLKKKTTNE